jgi:hypothetical protein
VLCGILVLVLGSVPDIEERLREAQPGKGRQSTASNIAGAKNAFVLDKQLPDKLKQVLLLFVLFLENAVIGGCYKNKMQQCLFNLYGALMIDASFCIWKYFILKNGQAGL